MPAPEEESSNLPSAVKKSRIVRVKTSKEESFAEVLTQLRGKVKTEDLEIINISRAAASGDLIITARNQEQAEKLARRIRATGRDKVEVLGPRARRIHIRGMHDPTTEEERKSALGKYADARNIKIVFKRPGRPGTLTTCVELPVSAAKKVIEDRTLQVGWARCQTREFLADRGCFRYNAADHKLAGCWLKEGEKVCYKCGKPDHLAKTCPVRDSSEPHRQPISREEQLSRRPYPTTPGTHQQEAIRQAAGTEHGTTGGPRDSAAYQQQWPALPAEASTQATATTTYPNINIDEKTEAEITRTRALLETERTRGSQVAPAGQTSGKPKMVNQSTQTEEMRITAPNNAALLSTWRNAAAAHPPGKPTAGRPDQRNASTPSAPEEKQQERDATSQRGAEKVNGQAQRRGKRTKKKSDHAILISHPEIEYADIVARMRELAKGLPTCGITTVRRTQRGELVMELSSASETIEWADRVRKNLGPDGKVTGLDNKETVKLRHMDAMTTGEEIREAIANATETPADTDHIQLIRLFKYPWEETAALIRVTTEAKEKLVSKTGIRVGITVANICRSPAPGPKAPPPSRDHRKTQGLQKPRGPPEAADLRSGTNAPREMEEGMTHGGKGKAGTAQTPPIREGGGEEPSGSCKTYIDMEDLLTPSEGDMELERHFDHAMSTVRAMGEGPSTPPGPNAPTPGNTSRLP